MAKLTVVFEYPDGASMIEAKRMFTSESSNIPNIVGVAEYDAIEAYERLEKEKLEAKAEIEETDTTG